MTNVPGVGWLAPTCAPPLGHQVIKKASRFHASEPFVVRTVESEFLVRLMLKVSFFATKAKWEMTFAPSPGFRAMTRTATRSPRSNGCICLTNL